MISALFCSKVLIFCKIPETSPFSSVSFSCTLMVFNLAELESSFILALSKFSLINSTVFFLRCFYLFSFFFDEFFYASIEKIHRTVKIISFFRNNHHGTQFFVKFYGKRRLNFILPFGRWF